MNIIIEVYFLLCVALLAFDLVFLVVKNHRVDGFAPRDDAFSARLSAELARRRETVAFSDDFAAVLRNGLTQTRHLMTVCAEMERDADAALWLRDAVFEQLDTYAKKSEEERAYYAYVLSTLEYDAQPIPPAVAGELLEFLRSDSLYVFGNTMDAFYRFGEVHLLLAALQRVEQRGEFYHKKLLVDGLLGARGDRAALQTALLERFDCTTPLMQTALLDYFRMSGFAVRELCERLIAEKETQTEVRRAALRCLSRCAADSSRRLLLRLLRAEDTPWVEQMLAIQCLEGWSDAETLYEVAQKLTSRHWYVRVYAAAYLHRHADGTTLAALPQLEDAYAAEALLYHCRSDHAAVERLRAVLPRGEEVCV